MEKNGIFNLVKPKKKKDQSHSSYSSVLVDKQVLKTSCWRDSTKQDKTNCSRDCLLQFPHSFRFKLFEQVFSLEVDLLLYSRYPTDIITNICPIHIPINSDFNLKKKGRFDTLNCCKKC